jgi:hypothetical protein
MNLNKRLAALERQIAISGPTTLTMADGSTVRLAGPSDHLLRLLGSVFRESNTPVQVAHLDLIRRSASCREPGGSHIAELIRALLLSPIESSVHP